MQDVQYATPMEGQPTSKGVLIYKLRTAAVEPSLTIPQQWHCQNSNTLWSCLGVIYVRISQGYPQINCSSLQTPMNLVCLSLTPSLALRLEVVL